jgi:hypothetical protein
LENKTKPFFWLHIKKCGGESFRATFTPPYIQSDRIKNPKPFIAEPKEKWNDVLNNYRIPLGEYDYKRMLFAKKFLYTEEEFQELFKFVIVRNPYDRAISCWKYVLQGKSSYTHPKLLRMKYSFRYFLESLPEIWEEKKYRHMATHTAPIWGDIADENNNSLVNLIIKLENISEDITILNNAIGTSITKYKKTNDNKNREKITYKKQYSSKTRLLVEDLYRNDIELLNYEF